jgi:hypothetical protein
MTDIVTRFTEWLASIERDAYNRGEANAEERLYNERVRSYCNHPEAQQLLPRVESLEVRAELATALGVPVSITSEEPDPGRDWSRVEGHLFKPSGKWGYQVWLDYTGERRLGVSGEGPHGWHFDGHEMAKRALHRATTNGTSGVTISALGSYWHLFVPHPPQGFPHWVQPDTPTMAEQEQDEQLRQPELNEDGLLATLETQAAKLGEIREFVRMWQSAAENSDTGDLRMGDIAEVLDR